MATYEDKWFEVWYSDGEDVIPTHLLLVVSDPKKSNQILIVDPSENDRVVFQASNYDAATDWLIEDDTRLPVEGNFLTMVGPWPPEQCVQTNRAIQQSLGCLFSLCEALRQ